ncbi:SMP-30/gluconolactonase/LRE family protein [Actinomadura livida]|uniref:SMP-30/gluconolactonase/LRE family protein n=1 Tax=Actinomadura livida TaxID=79909 RepID=A0A7W7MUY5_9ACTN|nr:MULTISPECIES: SMP-30/gluconolactonase/LRE family protein [Actinomadura]MBB4772071.1 sugar lactone lactonase YvrE [Actinomadura catellatispora]GGU04479.1 gluconolactonase [Actinomadura livida]
MKAEQITDPVAYHGEGPVWSDAWGGLRWLDMLAGDVLSLASDGTVARRNVGTVVAAIRPRRRGGAVLAVERGFALEDADGAITSMPPLWNHDRVRMNEGGCDPDGRFYCGSMAYDQREGAASVYRLDPDGSTAVVLDGVTISNGLEWSPDGARAYYVDTATERIDVFDYDRERGLTGRRPFAAALPGPDGLTVDEEGGVWVALYNGGSVRRYAPDGGLDQVVDVPVSKATACTFGGPGLDRLFITTSRENLDPGAEPEAGALFACTPGVRGVPAREFAG